MIKSVKVLMVGAAIAAAGVAQPASAAMRHHRHVVRVHYVGATLKPGYVGAPGFVGGPPGPAVPMLFDYPAPLGVFAGIPVLGALGL